MDGNVPALQHIPHRKILRIPSIPGLESRVGARMLKENSPSSKAQSEGKGESRVSWLLPPLEC